MTALTNTDFTVFQHNMKYVTMWSLKQTTVLKIRTKCHKHIVLLQILPQQTTINKQIEKSENAV